MSIIIGVSKAWGFGGRKTRHWRAEKHLNAYSLDDNGKIHRKRISKAEAIIFKLQIHKRITVHCTGCGHKFLKLVKKKKDRVECPNCQTLG